MIWREESMFLGLEYTQFHITQAIFKMQKKVDFMDLTQIITLVTQITVLVMTLVMVIPPLITLEDMVTKAI